MPPHLALIQVRRCLKQIMAKKLDCNCVSRACQYVFGPVPSRRLGLSLGLDLVPPKTCTLDCLYCEVGRTTRLTMDRFDLGLAPELLRQLGEHLPEYQDRLDYITLAGSGEPTLNSEMGLIIDRVKSMTTVPVAVLTNGTLLDRADVRQDLARADLVVPSLDTVRAKTFSRLNRPHPQLNLERIIEGLFKFREEYRGHFWLEVLLVSGYNDSLEELEATRAVVEKLRPDRIQVNTVFRPPASEAAMAVSPEALEEAARYLGQSAEPVAAFSRAKAGGESTEIRAAILSTLGRRPCTSKDVADSLGLTEEQIKPLLGELEESRQVSRDVHNRQTFYRRTPEAGTAEGSK